MPKHPGRSDVECRFIAEIDTHIARAKSGTEPEEALTLLNFFCKEVARGATPPPPLLGYIAEAFSKAIVARNGRPENVDCRKALGLVRAKPGNPHRKTNLTADEVSEVSSDGSLYKAVEEIVATSAVSSDHAGVMVKAKRKEEMIQIGLELHSQLRSELESRARGVPDLVAQAEVSAIDTIKRRYAAEDRKLSNADIKRAQRAFAKAIDRA